MDFYPWDWPTEEMVELKEDNIPKDLGTEMDIRELFVRTQELNERLATLEKMLSVSCSGPGPQDGQQGRRRNER